MGENVASEAGTVPTADDTVLGRYQLVRKLATGGMAEVFLAKAVGPGGFEKTLVIKRILPKLAEDPEFVEMFLHEAKLTAQLNHPNVVQIFDFGQLEGSYYLAMEYVDGPNLRSIIRRMPNKRLPLGLAARAVTLACEGLAYAHEFVDPATGQPLGLIHRDVTPDNLLLGRTGAVKVFDFGVAKTVGRATQSEAGTLKGKIAYMPPEQMIGEPDLRVDVYALGVILYELASGTKPYDQTGDVQLMTAILQTPPVPLQQRMPEVPEEYARIVAKAMARDVSQRYASCRELAYELDDFLHQTRERWGPAQIGQFVAATMAQEAPSSTSTSGSYPATPISRAAKATGAFPAASPAPPPPPGVPPSAPRGFTGAFPAASAVPPPPPSVPPRASRTGFTGSFPAVAPVAPRTPTGGALPAITSKASEHPPRAKPMAGVTVTLGGDPFAGFGEAASPKPSEPIGDDPFAAFGRADDEPSSLLLDDDFGPPEEAAAEPVEKPTPAVPPPAAAQAMTVTAGSAPAAPPRAPPAPAPESPAEQRARALMAESETMRVYEAGARLGSVQELDAIRAELELDEGANLLVRFPQHVPHLLRAMPDSSVALGERILGAIDGLLLSESYGRLARLLTRLEAEAGDPTVRWIYDTARTAFLTADQAALIAGRLREGAPPDPEGFGAFLRFFGGELASYWLAVADAMESGGGRDALLLGLAELARLNPEPFLARLQEQRPKRLAELIFIVEKGRANDRQRIIRKLLGQRETTLTCEVLTGLAKAKTDEACNYLAGALGDRVETVRVHALELLGQHFPARVFSLVKPLLAADTYQARSPAEREAIWKAVGGSNQPEALQAIAEVLKQKSSLLNRAKVDGLKLEALEALGVMKGTQAAELLGAVTGDRGQSEAVASAAVRLLSREPDDRAGGVTEPRRFDKNPGTPRELLLELAALSRAARLVDPRHKLFELPLARLRWRLEAILQREKRAEVVVSGTLLTFNGGFIARGNEDAAVALAAGGLARRGIQGFSFSNPTVNSEALQHLVRWLAEGNKAEGVITSGITRRHTSGEPDLPGRPAVEEPETRDPSRDAMVHYVDLIFAMRGWLTERARQPMLPVPDLRGTLHELAGLMRTRSVRFLGSTPYAVGRDAVLFHFANVTLISLGFAAELGLSRARMCELAEHAFFHDFGMLYVPEETLTRAGELEAEDKRALGEARNASTRFPFTRMGDAPGAVSWSAVVIEHGLDWGAKSSDGTVKQQAEVGLVGSIVTLAKMYDALTSRRSFRPPMTSAEALEVLLTKANHRFRPELLPLFARYVQRVTERPLRK